MSVLFLYQAVILAVLLALGAMAWRNHRDYRVPRAVSPAEWDEGAPLVSILAPVRNEATNLRQFLESLLRQSYPRYEVMVLDDNSTDGTAALVREIAKRDERVRLISGSPLPAGWAGKTYACHQAAMQARGDWLLFLDADTRAEPGLLSSALRKAMETEADLLSGFPRQVCHSLGEALTVPFIYWVLFMLLPIRRVWTDPRPEFAAACGQVLLVRRAAYEAIGGHGAISASLHDGLHLARLFKREGLRVRLADLSPYLSCRMYEGWTACWRGFSRNAYQALGSVGAVVVVIALEAGLFLAPFFWLVVAALVDWPVWSWLVLTQVALLLGVQISLRRRFGYPWLTVLFHPLGIAVLIGIQGTSFWRHLTRQTTTWRGREVGGADSDTVRAELLTRSSEQ